MDEINTEGKLPYKNYGISSCSSACVLTLCKLYSAAQLSIIVNFAFRAAFASRAHASYLFYQRSHALIIIQFYTIFLPFKFFPP